MAINTEPTEPADEEVHAPYRPSQDPLVRAAALGDPTLEGYLRQQEDAERRALTQPDNPVYAIGAEAAEDSIRVRIEHMGYGTSEHAPPYAPDEQ